jgi:hypothetical protein
MNDGGTSQAHSCRQGRPRAVPAVAAQGVCLLFARLLAGEEGVRCMSAGCQILAGRGMPVPCGGCCGVPAVAARGGVPDLCPALCLPHGIQEGTRQACTLAKTGLNLGVHTAEETATINQALGGDKALHVDIHAGASAACYR